MKYKNGFSEQKDCDIYKQRPFMSIKHIFPKSCYSFKQLSFLPQVQNLKKIYAGNFFSAGVDTSTPAQYIFHVYLVVNINRELKFKMVVTVGLQDISHTGILICFHFIRLLFKN